MSLWFKTGYGIIKIGNHKSRGGSAIPNILLCHIMERGGAMDTFQTLSLMILFAMLIIAILNFKMRKK